MLKKNTIQICIKNMTYHSIVSSNSVPPTAKLHVFWVCQPKMQGRNMKYWGYSKEEAHQKAKDNNPGASILWKKEL
tara:strand:+ start:703 stop:930 length:228 start_codon:yes stop_codon:yes gene_type:complete